MPPSFYAFEILWWSITLFISGHSVLLWYFSVWSIPTRSAITLGSLLILGILLYGHFIEPRKIRVKTQPIPLPQQCPIKKIAVVSDFHLGVHKRRHFVDRVVTLLNEQSPDLILMPGDFLNGQAKYYAQELEPLKNLNAPTYFVLGNHDYQTEYKYIQNDPELLTQKLESWGVLNLTNKTIKITDNCWLAGIDDPYCGNPDIQGTFKHIPKKAEVILLCHSADIWRKLPQKPDLTVCGHTHGGQIQLPLFGTIPWLVPVKDKRFLSGWYAPENVFISAGLGESGLSMRFLCPPEVVILKSNPQ